MVLYVTKKLADKLKLALKPLQESDDFCTWRANLTKDGHKRLLVFMNDASRYVLVVHRPMAKDFKRLPELFRETLREALLAEQINPDVIDCYISDLGDIAFAPNSGRQKAAWLNTACNNAWYGSNMYTDNTYSSVFASHLNIGNHADNSRSKPSEMLKELLKRYGLPVVRCTAFDITIKLDLDGNDAVRRLRVPANTSFEQFHKLLQKAFSWKNYHLYSFWMFTEWSDNYYAIPDVELVEESDCYDAFEINPGAKSIAGVKLSEYVPKYTKILYRYDFGDDWHHYIEVESIIEDCEDELPTLLSGEGDSPPEDVGGSGGFAEFLEAISDVNHEDYEHLTQWAQSQRWARFDIERISRSVKNSLWW